MATYNKQNPTMGWVIGDSFYATRWVFLIITIAYLGIIVVGTVSDDENSYPRPGDTMLDFVWSYVEIWMYFCFVGAAPFYGIAFFNRLAHMQMWHKRAPDRAQHNVSPEQHQGQPAPAHVEMTHQARQNASSEAVNAALQRYQMKTGYTEDELEERLSFWLLKKPEPRRDQVRADYETLLPFARTA